MVGINTFFANVDAGLEGTITSLGLRTVGISSLALIVLIIIASQVKDRFPILKLPLFITIATVIVGSTVFLFGSTIYLNLKSDSGGPVHWHANVEYWACGSEVELRDPYKFLSNKIGTPVLHEHNDKWIHLEGVVVDLEVDATIGHFMKTVGGDLTKDRLAIPINNNGSFVEQDIDGDRPNNTHVGQLQEHVSTSSDGSRLLDLRNGQTCGSEVAEVQVFVYQYNEDDKTYTQYKLAEGVTIDQQVKAREHAQKTLVSAADYIYTDNSAIPPGDCIILEFDAPKDYTDKLCKQYGLKDSVRCQEFGVTKNNIKLCNITDITDYSAKDSKPVVQPNTTSIYNLEEQILFCEAYYTNGKPNGIEIAIFKPDGALVDVSKDCGLYQQSLTEGVN